ncbi:MAG: TIGR03086 family metal-binding protein [Acidimicrobiales bacterium]
MSGDSPVGAAEVVGYYRQASAGFGEQVVAVGDEQWDLSTPCEQWIIKAVVAHVVIAEAQVPDLVGGHASQRFDVDTSVLGPDPVSVWRGTAIAALEAVAEADLDMLVEHPLGTLELRQVVGFRITENVVHAWDIAIGRGADLEVDPALARWCLDFWLPFADTLAGSGVFGSMVEPARDTPGDRLLGLMGRSA